MPMVAIVAQGTFEQVCQVSESVTGQYLSGEKTIPIPYERQEPMEVDSDQGAQENNLKNIDVDIPWESLWR